MMSISDIVQTEGWRKFMAKLYGLGAAVVLLGALFKIQHWPLAGLMLTIGMTTEVIIFFFSAFEPVHEEVDWSIVYPELAGIEEDMEEARERNKARRQAMDSYASAPPASESGGAAPGGGGAAGLSKFDEMLENAEITPELFNSLGDGLKKLNDTAKNMTNISDAAMATNEYVENMQAATQSISHLTDTYNKSHTDLNDNITNLSNVYQESVESIKESGSYVADKMAEGGKAFADKINQSAEEIANSYKEISDNVRSGILENNNTFNQRLEEINNHLSALNSAYELQLNSTNEHVKTTQSIYGEMDKVMNDLRESVDETKKYREEISKLNQNLSELNNIYGNMLSAMSVMENNI